MDSFDRPRLAGLDDENGGAQRARTRDSLFLMGSLLLADESKPRDVRIRNLSEGGLMIEIDRSVAIDAPLKLALRGIGDVAGKVAWCAEGRIGVSLDRPIDPRLARKPVGRGEKTPVYAKPLLGRR